MTQLFDRLHLILVRWREDHSNHVLIVKIKDYITVHYTSPELSLQHLSDKFGLSPRYVSKLFKDTYGEKFVDYVASIRMEKAKERLLESTESVQEIAESVGYATDISFIRTFKRIVGQTPGEFRKT
jgi:YesN/AraC family two-component response regulator